MDTRIWTKLDFGMVTDFLASGFSLPGYPKKFAELTEHVLAVEHKTGVENPTPLPVILGTDSHRRIVPTFNGLLARVQVIEKTVGAEPKAMGFLLHGSDPAQPRFFAKKFNEVEDLLREIESHDKGETA